MASSVGLDPDEQAVPLLAGKQNAQLQHEKRAASVDKMFGSGLGSLLLLLRPYSALLLSALALLEVAITARGMHKVCHRRQLCYGWQRCPACQWAR